MSYKSIAFVFLATIAVQQLNSQSLVRFECTSTPPGAQVFLDSLSVGVTPCSDSTTPLKVHIIQIELEGYLPIRDSVVFIPDSIRKLEWVLQRPATLEVHSIPDSSIVFVNSRRAGRTPLIVTGLHPGETKIMIAAQDHESWSTSITLSEGQSFQVTGRLTPSMADLVINADSMRMRVFIDSEQKQVDSRFNLALGIHHVTAHQDSLKRSISEDILLTSGQHTIIEPRFRFFSWNRMLGGTVLPGIVQLSDGSFLKGTVLLTASVGSVLAFLDQRKVFNSRTADYSAELNAYTSANNEANAANARSVLLAKYDRLNQSRATYDIALVIVGIVFLTNAADVYLNHSITDELLITHPAASKLALQFKIDNNRSQDVVTSLSVSIPL